MAIASGIVTTGSFVLRCREPVLTDLCMLAAPNALEVQYEEPVEKLWRWLRQDILKMHRWAEDWLQVKPRVHKFLDQFTHGSSELLRSVGLVDKGTRTKRTLNR
jgi:hypothetical protein